MLTVPLYIAIKRIIAMETKEIIKVMIHIYKGHIDCICLYDNRCDEPLPDCELDEIEYDKYKSWEQCMDPRKFR